MVYFIQDSRTLDIKIGYTGSDCVTTRLNALQTGNPGRLEVIACVPGEQCDETKLHVQFLSARVGGEWFRPVPELIRHIALIVVGQGMYEEGRGRGRKDALEHLAKFVTGRDSTPPQPPPTEREQSPIRHILVKHRYAIGVLVKHDEYGTGMVTTHVPDPQERSCLHKIKIRFPGHGEKTFLTHKVKLEVVPRAERQ